MLGVVLRRLTFFAVALAACGAEDRTRYLGDAAFRRTALVSSLVNPANGYSRLRIAHYARDWDALPEWNPAVVALDLAGDEERVLDFEDPKLGEQAFFRYPTQVTSRADLPSTVRVRLDDGSTETALTCATCHSRIVAGDADATRVPGLANQELVLDETWGHGRVDVAFLSAEEPVAIPDLRPVALQTHLHADGTVRNEGPVTLATRIETLLITAHAMALRPPRAITWALADYLRSLAPRPPPPDTGLGATLFATRCASCHVPPSFAGLPVALADVGTDPRVGESADRGTGAYRVPSLRGVGTRGRLLHDGSIPDLGALLDPARTISGHRFALDLPPEERAALRDYLSAL